MNFPSSSTANMRNSLIMKDSYTLKKNIGNKDSLPSIK